MKILVSSDIHGDGGMIREFTERGRGADLVLYCGDISSGPTTGTHDLEKLIEAFAEIGKPCRFVRGNCDGFEAESEYFLGNEEEFDGVRVIPFEDILATPFGTFREVSEERIAENLSKIDGKDAIVLAHQPPHGAGDRIPNGMNVGSRAVREWIERERLAYWLCGHVHEGKGRYMIGETIVINAAKSFVELEIRS
ncbi:MAG: metallophosphoesterase [Oscillospiraceae bacterium]|nr:metallophosphoesterase [Oscillospiraceae bacterium]